MKRFFKAALLFTMALMLLSACSASVKEEQNGAKDAVSEGLKSGIKKANEQNEDIEYYLPFGYEVKEEEPNNIILKNGSKTYILFYNQHESPDSKVVYNATIKQSEFNYNETFEENGSFAFLLVKNTDDNMHELTVGVGGVKMTTQVKTKNLSAEAAAMIEMVRSVKMK